MFEFIFGVAALTGLVLGVILFFHFLNKDNKSVK